MALTRGQLLDQVIAIIGDKSTPFREFLRVELNKSLYKLWDKHDWEFKHKQGTVNTVADQEEYDLSIANPDIRSSQDIDILIDTTNGIKLDKTNLRDIRNRFPKSDESEQPRVYAPWGTKTITLHPIPNAVFVLKFPYLAKPTLPTDDLDDIEAVVGLPDFVHHILQKMLLSDAYVYIDDSRYNATITELEQVLIPDAIKADMKHLESPARFRHWEEEFYTDSYSFNDFMAHNFFNFNGNN